MSENSGVAYARKQLTGGQLIVESLIAEGVDTLFGITGSHVLAIYDALRDAPQIRHVTTCHEHNAALMAEAYSRLTGRPGVVIVTAGPGGTNAVSGIAQAYTTASPVVIITGSVPLDAKKEIFHGVDDPTFLHQIFSAVTKRSVRIERPEDTPGTIADAFARALGGRPGPVHVEIDEVVLKATTADAPEHRVLPRQKRGLDPAVRDRIVERLRAGKRPVLVAGRGVLSAFAGGELAKLADILAAPVIFPADAQGAVSYGNRWCVGVPWTIMGTNSLTIKLIREADPLLGIGLRPNAWNLEAIVRNAPSNFVFVGFDDEQVQQEGASISCVADAKATLQELVGQLESRPRTPDDQLLAEVAANKKVMLEAFRGAIDPYRGKPPLHFGLALEELARHLTPDTIVIGDVGNHSVWTTSYLSRLGADRIYHVGSWAAMGYALPGAIGAKIACPEQRVVGITGDGSFLMASADFATAVQNRLSIVYLILHDNRHGMVEMLQRRDYGRTYATELTPPDFAKYAESFGAVGIRIERTADLSSAFQQAFMAEGPVVLDVISDAAAPYPQLPS